MNRQVYTIAAICFVVAFLSLTSHCTRACTPEPPRAAVFHVEQSDLMALSERAATYEDEIARLHHVLEHHIARMDANQDRLDIVEHERQEHATQVHGALGSEISAALVDVACLYRSHLMIRTDITPRHLPRDRPVPSRWNPISPLIPEVTAEMCALRFGFGP